jgi:hypothetical protein
MLIFDCLEAAGEPERVTQLLTDFFAPALPATSR